MKISANFEDKNRIREWAATGLDAEAISQRVRVKADYVAAYLKSLEPKLSPQQKGALTKKAKREQEEAEAQSQTTEAQ